jgi:hypothetical protein
VTKDEDDQARDPVADRDPGSMSRRGCAKRALAAVRGFAFAAALGTAAFASYQAVDARDDLRVANDRIDQLEQRADDYEADADLLAEAAGSLDGRVSDLETEISGLTDFGGAVSRVDDLDSRVADLEVEVAVPRPRGRPLRPPPARQRREPLGAVAARQGRAPAVPRRHQVLTRRRLPLGIATVAAEADVEASSVFVASRRDGPSQPSESVSRTSPNAGSRTDDSVRAPRRRAGDRDRPA